MQLELKIITPEKSVFDSKIDSVILPCEDGLVQILPEHASFVSTLTSGEIVANINGEESPFAVVGGFVEVKDNVVMILADFAEHVSDISDSVIEKAKQRAEELKKQKENQEIVDFEHFESELERALTRVKIADKWRTKKYI